MTTSSIMNTYGAKVATFVEGRGCWLWDSSGSKYLDALSGIAVCGLGHSHPHFAATVAKQANTLTHCSNFFGIPNQQNLADKLCEISGMTNIFFGNSGAEANEAAIKIARKYHSSNNSPRSEIVSFEGSFHGRSLLNISLGGTELHKKGFEPLMPGIKHGVFNDIKGLENLISEKTAAVIIEPVQGEAGVYSATQEFMDKLRSLTSIHGALLIVDEVQSGVGRMGSLYGYMHYEIEPDILTSAKGLGGGMPIGATLTTRSIGEGMQPGTHGSTFGGNPMACAVADTVLTVVSDKEFLDEVLRKEKLFVKLLNELNEEKSVFSAIRSEGLWIGCDLINEESSKVIDRCYDNGLILVSAGSNCLRLAPALNINDDDIKEGIEILKQVF